MMGRLYAAIDWFLTPSAFQGDPRGSAANQVGRLVFGAAALGDPTRLLAATPFLLSGVARRDGL